MTLYVRFQSSVPNRRGTFPGVFALANGLARNGFLSSEDLAWHAQANKAADRAYTDPSTVVPDVFDHGVNPGARCWFRADAAAMFELTKPYLELLDRYHMPWTELRTSHPGRIVYEDDVQVVAVPRAPDDWPLGSR